MPDLSPKVARASIRCTRGPCGAIVIASILAFTHGCATPSRPATIKYCPPPPATPRAVHLASFGSLGELLPGRSGLFGGRSGGESAGRIESPMGIAFRANHLYICDTGLRTVHDWDLGTGTARHLEASAAAFRTPVAVAADDAERTYVADSERGEVLVFDSAGAYQTALRNSAAPQYRPVALAVTAGKLFVADAAGSKIDVFSTPEYTQAGSLPLGESGKGVFPSGLAVANDRLLVADMFGGRILALDLHGALQSTISRRGDRYGDLGQPRHLAVGPDGVVFIADPEFGHVHLFDLGGNLLMLLGGQNERPGHAPGPVGVAVAESLPENLTRLVPQGFAARYFLFVSHGAAARQLDLFALGSPTGVQSPSAR